MSGPLSLVIFDVDGTLVDSQGHILASMNQAFSSLGLSVPSREAVLGIVGLSLGVAMQRLAPHQTAVRQTELVQAYKSAFRDLRQRKSVASPLYPGTREMLAGLASDPSRLMGVATGKSARGLRDLIAAHELEPYFLTRQTADHHPSKPHPSMLRAAMDETGVSANNTLMIGDTTFDRDMAKAAGVRFVAVGWGYHPVSLLADADAMIGNWTELPGVLAAFEEETA